MAVGPVEQLGGRVVDQRRQVSWYAEWQKLTSKAGRSVNLKDVPQMIVRYDEKVIGVRQRS